MPVEPASGPSRHSRDEAWDQTAVAHLQRVYTYAEAAEIVPSTVCQVGPDWLAPFKPDTVVELNGEAHATRRRIESALFRREALQQFEVGVLEHAMTAHFASLAAGRGADGCVRADLVTATRDPLIALVSHMFGLDIDLADHAALDRLKAFIPVFGAAAALRFKLGSIEQDVQAALAAGVEFRAGFFQPAWERRRVLLERYRRGELGQADLPADLMMILALHDIPEQVVMKEIILFLHAGVDTMVMAVLTSVHHLDGWLRDHPEDQPRVADVSFLQGAAFEAIRLHPPPAAIRMATEDLVLSTGRRIGAGEEVIVDITCANRDRAVFGEDADEFNPRRTLPRSVRAYGFGFGGGTHLCPGKPMAVAHGVLTDDDRDDSTGTVARIMARLYEAGLELDPADPPQVRQGSLHERYTRFPAILANL